MLKHRFISSTFIVALLLAIALWMPGRYLTLVVAAIGAVGAWETAGFLAAAKIPHQRLLGVAGGVAWVLAAGWGRGHVPELESLVLTAVLVAAALAAMARPDGQPLVSVPATLFIVLYAPFLISFIIGLLHGFGGDGRYLALYMILVVKVADTGAYFIGSAYGRHKVFPRISPAKTWEGCAGGVAVATLASAGVVWAAGGDFGVVHIPLGQGILLGVLLASAGIFGDLLESMFKRAAGLKDSGCWIRGMGGVLDVIDSLILAAPVLYVYLRFFHV